MAERKGFLLVSMDPPPLIEEEYNDWYDTEHIPGRAGIEGFESARRFVCVNGWPKYLSLYDLAGIDVLESEPYKKASWGGFSAWTKRMLPKMRGQYRASGEQIYPGDALTGTMTRMVLLRFSGVPDHLCAAIRDGLLGNYAKRAETRQMRLLRSDYNQQIDYIALVEASAPYATPALDVTLFGDAAPFIDLVNEYVPYWTRGPLAGVFGAS